MGQKRTCSWPMRMSASGQGADIERRLTKFVRRFAVSAVSFPVRSKKFPVPIAGNSTANPLWMLASSLHDWRDFDEIP